MMDKEWDLDTADYARDLERALQRANVPTLLLLLVQLTGELRWLEDPYLPTPIGGMTDHDTGGLPEVVQAKVRAESLVAILDWKRGKPMAIGQPDRKLLQKMLSVSVGEDVPMGYVDMVAGTMERSKQLAEARQVPLDRDDGFHVLIIGAGVSGLSMAVRLQNMGVPYTIYEKGASVGGTWNDNRYPGCGVDTLNHYYSFSFAAHDWEEYFCRAPELKNYLEEVADRFNLRSRVVLNTEVLRAEFDEGAKEWVVHLKLADGAIRQRRTKILISAVGLFNPPSIPAIEGLSIFQGPVVHTGKWQKDLAWHGKRVAIVGSGASAMQLATAMAPHVEKLTIFQRTPQWSIPLDEKWRGPVDKSLRWLMREVPTYTALYRERMGWVINDRSYPLLTKDPSWPHPERSLNAASEELRVNLTNYIHSQLPGRPDLAQKSVPAYPPFGKRMLIDHGWYDMLVRENVELVAGRVERLTRDSVVSEGGSSRQVDIVALATGYDVLRLLSTFELVGRSGISIREIWGEEDGAAYWGLTIPGFPNFFCLYGPYSQPAHGGSYISVAEQQGEYVSSIINQMLKTGTEEIEIRQDLLDKFIDKVYGTHENMVWSHQGVKSYYRNSKGRVVINHPFRNYDVWNETRAPDISEFIRDKTVHPRA